MAESKPLDFEIVHRYVFAKCLDYNLAWDCVNTAYIDMIEKDPDRLRTTGEQVNFMKTAAYGFMLNEQKRRRKYIADSRLTDMNASQFNDNDPDKSFFSDVADPDSMNFDEDELSMIQLLLRRNTDDDITLPLIYVLDKVFSGYFKVQIKPEDIRNCLKVAKGIPMKNVSECARKIHRFLNFEMG